MKNKVTEYIDWSSNYIKFKYIPNPTNLLFRDKSVFLKLKKKMKKK